VELIQQLWSMTSDNLHGVGIENIFHEAAFLTKETCENDHMYLNFKRIKSTSIERLFVSKTAYEGFWKVGRRNKYQLCEVGYARWRCNIYLAHGSVPKAATTLQKSKLRAKVVKNIGT
jgi:hypothetical protein